MFAFALLIDPWRIGKIYWFVFICWKRGNIQYGVDVVKLERL